MISSAAVLIIVAHIGRASTSVSTDWELLKSILLVILAFIQTQSLLSKAGLDSLAPSLSVFKLP